MLVLRKDVQKRMRGQIGADALERQASHRFALYPQIDRRNLVAEFEHGIGQIKLAVEFERPRLNCQGARGRSGLGRLVDDADLHPKLGKPERQDQAGWTGTNDQNVAMCHFVLRSSASPSVGRSRLCSAVRACWSASACKPGGSGQIPPKTSGR